MFRPSNATPPATTETRGRLAGLVFLVVLVAGVYLNARGCFHGQLWFDESYSTALAPKSLGEIWRIGSMDVHPVLYYWMLHLVYLVFGANLTAYRLFSLAAVAVLGLLGWTHVRRDFGQRAGILFTTLALFNPWSVVEAADIRMYAWAAVFVTLALLYCGRIARAVAAGDAVPAHFWLVAFLAALASAYSHYYAAMAAFCCMLVLFVCVVARAVAGDRGPLARFAIGAVACVGAYLPWIRAAMSQVSAVHASYWIEFEYPRTVLEFLQFPLRSNAIGSLMEGTQGEPWAAVATCGINGFRLVALAVVALLVWRGLRARRERPVASEDLGSVARPAGSRGLRVAAALADPAAIAAVAYFGTMVLSAAASLAMQQSILQARYLSTVMGAMALCFAVLLDKAGSRVLMGAGVACFVVLACVAQHWSCGSNYDWYNDAVLWRYDQVTRNEDGSLRPVVSAGNIGDNIVAAGPLSQLRPDVPITVPRYCKAYEAYAPTVNMVTDPAITLEDYHGRFVYVSNGDDPENVEYFAQAVGARVLTFEPYWRPYRSNMWAISVLEKE